jgi:hypothetical protein
MVPDSENTKGRKYPRYTIELKVSYTLEDKKHCALTYNIGKNGLFIVDDYPRPAGTLFNIEIELPDNRGNLLFIASVAWSGFATTSIKGMGVVFHSKGPSQEKLEAYVNFLAQTIPASNLQGDTVSIPLQEKAITWTF